MLDSYETWKFWLSSYILNSACDNWRDVISIVWRLHSLTVLCFNPQNKAVTCVLSNLTKCIVLSHLQKLCKFCIFVYFLFSLKNIVLDHTATMYTHTKPLIMQYSSSAWDSDLINSVPYQLVFQGCCKRHIYFFSVKPVLVLNVEMNTVEKSVTIVVHNAPREEKKHREEKERKQENEQNKSEKRWREALSRQNTFLKHNLSPIAKWQLQHKS